MSKPTQDGGPAFPFAQVSETTGQPINGCFNPGMTLRDWFAGMALPALISEPKPASITVQEIANAAYEYADAMLCAREQKEGAQ